MRCRLRMRLIALLLMSAALGLEVLEAPPSAQAIVVPSFMQQLRKVTAPDGAVNDHLGRAVAVSGDTMLTGAPFAGDPGAAYVFVRVGQEWVFQQKLVAPDGAVDDYFGTAVALSGNTALIGSPDDNDNGAGSGSAYVFTRSGATWTFQQKLKA
ncbi:MAG TPA: FG-GAP repeat protein, partial [Candidatus Limnocylindrales bacterium]